MDFNHRSPPLHQNGNSSNHTSNFHERSPYSNDSQSMLQHINNTPKQKKNFNSTETFYQHQHPSIYSTAAKIQPRRNLMDRRRAKSECFSPSNTGSYYHPAKSPHLENRQTDSAWSVHRAPRQLTNEIDKELDNEAEYNFPSWHSRNRYRASSESSSDYYYFRDNFPDIDDFQTNKFSQEAYSMSTGKYRLASHKQQQAQRVTNKASFSVLVNNNSNHHQFRHSPKLKARSLYLSHKAGLVRVSSPLHKKRIEMWKIQSQSANSNLSNHSNSNLSIPSNSIPSIDSHSASFTPKISPDEDDDEISDASDEEEEPPGPDDQIDDEMTDPEDTYESSLSLSYSDRSLPVSTLNTDCVHGGKVLGAPFAQSLFPFVPPYITFATFEEKGPEMPAAIHKQLKWKLTTITPLLVRKILLNTGFRLMKSESELSQLICYHSMLFA